MTRIFRKVLSFVPGSPWWRARRRERERRGWIRHLHRYYPGTLQRQY